MLAAIAIGVQCTRVLSVEALVHQRLMTGMSRSSCQTNGGFDKLNVAGINTASKSKVRV